ncbi:HlyD family type I secretion periplasmic adaptor subunit [Janthinobacterium sp. BJB304]|uniref:HlyD family type I secretion periplasmic adaptor subunit n=1 Tax=Janthinobacterium sp. BJB304 TaxID=1572871 RepID=UPI000C10C7F0|nr:HlyD family type I secretion periplasmic adaptor subunit [Janthinobacterium sp. BJB304]PHV35992.1 secretion protein HylD [Janthinobacterium sp. BJB304]
MNPQVQIVDPPDVGGAQSAKVVALRPPSRWHDPLQLIQAEAPSHTSRIVLWVVAVLVLVLIVWAAFGQLDIIAGAEGKLVPQTLVKIVQPAEAGVVKSLLVAEGEQVKAGQVLARLDTTIARADTSGFHTDLAVQTLQVRRIEAELSDRPMGLAVGDDPAQYAQVERQYLAHRGSFIDSLAQEKSLLEKVEHEERSAMAVLSKLEQTLPNYINVAENYAGLAKAGYMPAMLSAEKQREATEKFKDLEAQRATVSSLSASAQAQQRKIGQLRSAYKSELERELAEIRARIVQLQPNLDKARYKEGLTELRAPQDGVIKDLATTTVGAVVQPGTVVLTLVPHGEQLFADVNIKNEDAGFVQIGQRAQVKLAAYPFQKYGMLTGQVIHVSADATETARSNMLNATDANGGRGDDSTLPANVSTYKARIRLDQQSLRDPQGRLLHIAPGMQIVAEVNQGRRSVLEYLLSPVQKALSEAGRER